MMQSFRDLKVWQKAMDVADAVYTATATFPREELFGLTSQLRRAAVSIPSNIAEGRAIGGGRYLHHLRIAIGSEAELATQIEISVRRSYIRPERARSILEEAGEVRQMLHGLHRALRARRAAAISVTVLVFLNSSITLLA